MSMAMVLFSICWLTYIALDMVCAILRRTTGYTRYQYANVVSAVVITYLIYNYILTF